MNCARPPQLSRRARTPRRRSDEILEAYERRSKLFAELHRHPPFILPSAWDVTSARAMVASGAAAVASSNGGHLDALLLGGKAAYRERAIDLVARIVNQVDVPVAADLETAFGDDLDEVVTTTTSLICAGAVGINLEDSGASSDSWPGPPLYTPAEQSRRIAAARSAAEQAGVTLFVNARIDVFLLSVGEPRGRLDDVITRAATYTHAGADGIFVPALLDLAALRAIADATALPINVAAVPGAPPVVDLVAAGVTRFTPGSERARALLAHAQSDPGRGGGQRDG